MIVAVATVCLALGFGANITVSVVTKPLEEEFGWLRADISITYSMLMVGAAIGGPVWGSLSDRIGAKSIGFLGAIAISGGLRAASTETAISDCRRVCPFRLVIPPSGEEGQR